MATLQEIGQCLESAFGDLERKIHQSVVRSARTAGLICGIKRSGFSSFSSFKPSVPASAPREEIYDKNATYSSDDHASKERSHGPSPEPEPVHKKSTPTRRRERKDRQQQEKTSAEFQLALPALSTEPCVPILRGFRAHSQLDPYSLNSSRRRLVCWRETGTSVCFLSFIFSI